jgi:hypothetical protein
MILLLGGQRAEEGIDDVRSALLRCPLFDKEGSRAKLDPLPRLKNIKMIRFRSCFVDHRLHWYVSKSLQDFREIALLIGSQVRHEHKRHAGVRLKVLQDFPEGRQPSGRRPKSHNRVRQRWRLILQSRGFQRQHRRVHLKGRTVAQGHLALRGGQSILVLFL